MRVFLTKKSPQYTSVQSIYAALPINIEQPVIQGIHAIGSTVSPLGIYPAIVLLRYVVEEAYKKEQLINPPGDSSAMQPADSTQL